MYRPVARNIALNTPAFRRFAAVTAASEFAEKIIAKYTGTEVFPFSGEALVFFNALGSQLEGEKRLRDSVNYTLRLLMIRRLIVDGKVSDPTVTKKFASYITGGIENGLRYIRSADSSIYIKTVQAAAHIESSELSVNEFVSGDKNGDPRSYRLSAADMRSVAERFFGDAGGGYYSYAVSDIVFKREEINGSVPAVPGKTQDHVPTSSDGGSYEHISKELIYRTENNVSESSETQNVRNVSENAEYSENTSVSAPVTVNTAENSEVSSSVFITNATENIETRNGNSVVSSPIINTTETSETYNSESVINTGDTRYDYTNEELTYKTENSVSESSGTRNIRNVSENAENIENTTFSAPVTVNTAENSEVSSSVSVTNTTEKSEKRNDNSFVSAPVVNTTEFSENYNAETVINTGDTSYDYTNEEFTYKTENSVSESSGTQNVRNVLNVTESVTNARDTAVPAGSAGSGSVISAPELVKVSELADIGLLIMNSFMSGGTQYLSSVRNKYLHKRVSLVSAVRQERINALNALLGSPLSSFQTVTYAVRLLTDNSRSDPYEREIYDSSVTQVYLEAHNGDISTKEMFDSMSAAERTKVLTLAVEKLAKEFRGSGRRKAEDTSRPFSGREAYRVPGSAESERPGVSVDKNTPPAGKRRKTEKTDVPVPAENASVISERESQLLRLLAEDKSGTVLKLLGGNIDNGTISSQLKKLYSGIPGYSSGVAEGLLREGINTAAAADMTTVIREFSPDTYYISDNAPIHSINPQSYQTDVRNIFNMQSSGSSRAVTDEHILNTLIQQGNVRNVNNLRNSRDISQAVTDLYVLNFLRPQGNVRNVNNIRNFHDISQAVTEAYTFNLLRPQGNVRNVNNILNFHDISQSVTEAYTLNLLRPQGSVRNVNNIQNFRDISQAVTEAYILCPQCE